MSRILLAIEEYNELIFFETLLKKVGFDVMGVQNDLVISEKLMSFNPELMIISSQGTRVNGTKAIARLKAKGHIPPTIFVNPRGKAAVPSDKVVIAILDSPVSPRTLIELVASLFNMNEEQLLEKYEKSSEFQGREKEVGIHVQSKEPKETAQSSLVKFKEKIKESDERRKKRSLKYKQIAEKTPLPPFEGLKRALVVDQVKDFRREEREGAFKSIDEERIEFAKALSKKFYSKKSG